MTDEARDDTGDSLARDPAASDEIEGDHPLEGGQTPAVDEAQEEGADGRDAA